MAFIDATKLEDDIEERNIEIVYKEDGHEFAPETYGKLAQLIRERYRHEVLIEDVTIESFDGDWCDYAVAFRFKCEPNRLKEKIMDILEGEAPRADIFTVTDERGLVVFTEENLE